MISDYICTSCLSPTRRADLTVKKAVFLEMGAGAKTIRSRVIDWLCADCLASDPDYNREANQVPVSRHATE